MAQTILIVGQNKANVQKEAMEIAKANSSKFDILVYDALEANGIETIREVLTKAHKKPFESKVLTILLLNAELFTIEAQNALLKVLEEPPGSTQFLLTSQNRNRLLPTVASRCLELTVTREEFLEEKQIFEDFFEKKLSERLNLLDKFGTEDLLKFYEQKIKNSILSGKSSDLKIDSLRLKTLLKLNKAVKSSANKKLISLLSALT